MTELMPLLRDLPPNTLVYALVLAVLIAPWVYSWRNRVRRWLVRLAWIGIGVVVGMNL